MKRIGRLSPGVLFKTYVLCLAVFTATLSFAADPESLRAIAKPLSAKIDALLRAQIAGGFTPGIAVAMTRNGRIIYEHSEGVRDIPSGSPMLVTTPQELGSITKQFTAAAILMLQEEKRLSVDDPLSKYVPEYVLGDKMTLRQMLNMVSGISNDDSAIYGDQLLEPITRAAMLANLNHLPLIFEPGAHMVYTNTNFNLLGLIVERVSGQPYLTFLREHIFIPLDMSSTSSVDPPPPGLATGYFHEKPEQPFENRPEFNPDFLFATGNLVSTAPDLLKWDAGLLSKRLLNEASLRTMFKVPGKGEITTILETDPELPVIKHINDGGPTVYAMGWFRPDRHTRWHGGHTLLFSSANVLFSDGYNIAIIGNVRDEGAFFSPGNLAAQIHNLVNPALMIPPLEVILREPSMPAEIDLE